MCVLCKHRPSWLAYFLALISVCIRFLIILCPDPMQSLNSSRFSSDVAQHRSLPSMRINLHVFGVIPIPILVAGLLLLTPFDSSTQLFIFPLLIRLLSLLLFYRILVAVWRHMTHLVLLTSKFTMGRIRDIFIVVRCVCAQGPEADFIVVHSDGVELWF